MVFLNALQAMVSITLVTLLGYFLTTRGYIQKEVENFIPRFNLQIVIPLYLFGAVIDHFNHDQFLSLVKASIVPFMSMAVTFVLFWILARCCRMDRRHLGLAATAVSCSNTIFIGIPVNAALFGPPGLINLLLYFLSNSLFFWTVGIWAICREGATGGKTPSFREVLGHVFSPPLVGTLIGVLIVLGNIPVPRFVTDTCNLVGGICSPLALIFVGCTLAHIDWKTVTPGRDLAVTLTGRMVLAPLVMLIMAFVLPIKLPDLTRDVYTIQAALPCMTNISIVSAYYGADKEFGSLLVCLSTLVGMLTVPIWMTIVS